MSSFDDPSARSRDARAAADRRAADLQREVEEQALEYLAQTRRRIDAWAEGRIEYLQGLTTALAEQAEQLRERTARISHVKAQLDEVVVALGAAAARVAAEASETAGAADIDVERGATPTPFPMRPARPDEAPPQPPRRRDVG